MLVLIQERIGKHRIGEHVCLPDLADDLHKDLLAVNQILNVIDCIGSVRELYASEEGFQIGTIKDRYVSEGTLITICSACDRLG